MPLMARKMDLGGPPRVTDYRNWVQGVDAQTPQVRPSVGARIAAGMAEGLASLIRVPPAGMPVPGGLGNPKYYPHTMPGLRLGPVPKLATGSGMTATRPNISLGATPGGYTPPQQIHEAGMDVMPYLRESFNSALKIGREQPGGFPRKGVAATSGAEFIPTYQAHDWVWADRFAKHGRSPGPWQVTSFVGYRALQPVQRPRKYNLYNNVALARPLSPQAYFLGYQTSSDVAAKIGGGVNRPLGY